MATRSARQPHVRFASELTVPPADRQRKARKLTPTGQSNPFYPKVAQEKGRSERQSSFDLFWQWDRLSSVLHDQDERQHHQPKRLAAEAVLEKRDCTTLFSISRGTPQQMRLRELIFTGTGFGFDALSRTTCKRPWRETLRLPPRDVLKRPHAFDNACLEMLNPPPSTPQVGFIDGRLMV